MRTTLKDELYRAGVLLLVVLSFLCFVGGKTAVAAKTPTSIGGVSPEEALHLGEKMYRQGILPSGKPMQATVKDDVPVDGTMFTCVSCHLRCGVGVTEGKVRTPPIDGTRLFAPVSKFRRVPMLGENPGKMDEGIFYRPAYTEKTLARVLETGLDPANRQLNSVMPIYPLADKDKEILVHYLKNLSVGAQPGVTDTTLRFATVITEDVPQEDREAMLVPLQNYIENWRVPKKMERTIKSVAQRKEGSGHDLRTLALSVWELKGAPETWRGQLEEYYRKEPAFALLGGISTKDWSPIHRFCEDLKIPEVFPVTDFPVIAESDWYSLYFSKGLYQEGEAAARYLHGQNELQKEGVVQVFRNEPKGLALSKAFQEVWTGLGHKAPDTIILQANEAVSPELWKKIDGMHKQAPVLLWLNVSDFPDLTGLAKEATKPAIVLASASLLEQKVYSLPETERSYIYLTYPYALPQDSHGYRAHAAEHKMGDKIPLNEREPALKMQSLFQTISGPLSRLRAFVYRDYFLELIESTPDLTSGTVIYPRLSFGQGQRYASKGCYVVQLTAGPKPELVKRSEWVTH